MSSTTASRAYLQGATDGTTTVDDVLLNDGGGTILGWARRDDDTAGTNTTENALVCTDCPVNDGRIIVVHVRGSLIATGPTGLQVLVFEDSTELIRWDTSVYTSSVEVGFAFPVLSLNPDPGNHDYTLAYGISGGSGETCNMTGSTSKIEMFVQDGGPYFV